MTLDSNNGSDNNLFATIQQEYKILAEYKMIQSENIGGVYVIPSYENSFLWYGIIFVREGIYNDGIFRFTLNLPIKFPDDTEVPSVAFQSNIIHPLICPNTGLLDISEAFSEWNPTEYHLWQLLKFIQFIFQQSIACANGNVSNKDAAELIFHNKGEFLSKVKECVKISRNKIYDSPTTDDKHYITFEHFDNDIHGPILESIKNKTDLSMSPPTSGLSWVNQGEFKPLSK